MNIDAAQHTRPPSSPQAVAAAHRCAVAWCPTLCSPGHVSCRWHWRRVPQELRDPLIAAFRERSADPIGFALACAEGRKLVQAHAMSPMAR